MANSTNRRSRTAGATRDRKYETSNSNDSAKTVGPQPLKIDSYISSCTGDLKAGMATPCAIRSCAPVRTNASSRTKAGLSACEPVE